MQARTFSPAKLPRDCQHADHRRNRSAVDDSKLLDDGMHLSSARQNTRSGQAPLSDPPRHSRAQRDSSGRFGRASRSTIFGVSFHFTGAAAQTSRRWVGVRHGPDGLAELGAAGIGLRAGESAPIHKAVLSRCHYSVRRSGRSRSAAGCTWHNRCCYVRWHSARGYASTRTGPPRGGTWSNRSATEACCG